MFARHSISRRDDLGATRAAFAAELRAHVHPRVVDWLGDAAVAAAIRDEVAQSLAGCFDLGRAARARQLFGVPGWNDHDYCARLLATPDGRQVLIEPRFKGLRVDEAFVELLAHDFSLTPGGMPALLAACHAQYRRASPRWLRIYVGAHEALHPGWDELAWDADLHVVAGPVGSLRRPDGADALEARAVADPDACYARYAEAYDAFAAAASQVAVEVERIGRDDIVRHIDGGVAREVFAGDRWAGYVAAMPEPFMGASGYCVYEELLAPAFRGRGLGPALQWKLVEQLSPDAILWGTIHARNAPSLRTALRVGRLDLGHYRLVELSYSP